MYTYDLRMKAYNKNSALKININKNVKHFH